ncbi:acyl-CoA:lysophosphatidylglycerol acyltransferase 1-like [Saccostrea echinata]|uniref:acyl-CoA:lysophosphatidylglycerol acyltransferase 1-like n=1 Tax=Saccostrea echinata TaxID=191078 RepID=UPI002A7F60E4|nr:acyl-CoA:lysophosphatidylglycerol acyltransferase 1-like [Saccostrea echinata]XP_061174406.1 acyl-CoA:lysophosphatidylglycerol acyltransferase 1-like [Saccostrea echinata]
MRAWELAHYSLRIFFITVANLFGIPSYLTWILLLQPLKLYYPKLFWKIESILFQGLLTIVTTWLYSGGYTIIESGDSLEGIMNDEAVVLVNHQSTSDVPIVMSALHNKGQVIGKVMWVMDDIFKYTNFGWISYFHGDFFIVQGKEARTNSLEKLQKHINEIYKTTFKNWIILFPEGGFLRKRRFRSQEFAKKNHLPVLQHVTLPRVGALKVIMDNLASQTGVNGNVTGSRSDEKTLKWVIDMTIGYPGATPYNSHGMFVGYWPPHKVDIHYRVYPIQEVPTEKESLTKWLYDRYTEKEVLLQEFYTKSKPLDESDNQKRIMPRIKRHDLVIDKCIASLFYLLHLCSFIVFWFYLYCPVLRIIRFVTSFVF